MRCEYAVAIGLGNYSQDCRKRIASQRKARIHCCALLRMRDEDKTRFGSPLPQKASLNASCSVRAPLFWLLFFVTEMLLKAVVVKFNCPG